MKNLRPETIGILGKVEALSGRPVEFKPDCSLGAWAAEVCRGQVFDRWPAQCSDFFGSAVSCG
jgi:hypothetical protein